ncbi:MAG: glycosyltransferase [Planctomycetota bacterium]
MRVLLVSPSSVDAGPAGSGGVAGYAGDLAAALAELGHTVAVVSSGHRYRPGVVGRSPGRCLAFSLPAIGGIRRYEILNSPVLSPAIWQFGAPKDEASNRRIERAFADVLARFRPDAVHIHGFEGFTAGIVQCTKRFGAVCFVSVHNYHAFCPQVYLMRGRREPCHDYDGGRACETCEACIDIPAERARRASPAERPPPAIDPPPLPPIQRFDEQGRPTAATRALWSYDHPHWQPLDEDRLDPAAAGRVAGRYGQRRAAFVDALNRADGVLAVSSRVATITAAMGVDPARLRVMPIGSWAAGADRPISPPGDDSVLRLVFVGFNNYYKGLPMLVDALGLLSPSFQRRVHLAAFGRGCLSIRERAEALRPGLAGLELADTYRRETLPELFDGRHAGVVPSVWSDNGPQTAIEMRALGLPVLGARAGGIPEIIGDGREGLLFRANDRCDLACTIAKVIDRPETLTDLRALCRPWRAMSGHAQDLCGLYDAALS